MFALSVIAVNACGLNARDKRIRFFHWLRSLDVDVILLSETHCSSAEAAMLWASDWHIQSDSSAFSLSSSAHTGGSAILLHPRALTRSRHCRFSTHHSFNGALTLATVEYAGTCYSFASIYAPVDSPSRLAFFRHLCSVSFPAGPLIMGGDFNCVENPARDHRGISPAYHAQQPGGALLADLCARRQLVDGWLTFYGAGGPPPFTRYSPTSESATRIDRLYVSATLATSISAMSVVSAPWTDHAAVELRIGASTRPTASWRFNDLMLRSPSFCSQIRIAWLHWATDPEGRPLAQRWSAFKTQVRRIATAHAEAVNRELRSRIKRRVALSCQGRRREQHQLRREIQTRIAQAMDASLLAEAQSDRPTRHFFSRLKKHAPPRTIAELDSDDGLLTSPQAIAQELGKFWGEVFGHSPSPSPHQELSPAQVSAMSVSLDRLARVLTPDQRSQLAAAPSLDELHRACLGLRTFSAPGPDGLTPAFYRHFWDFIGPILLALLLDARCGGCLPVDSLEATILLIPKPTSGTPKAADFRPISLLNVEYKIWAAAIAARINPLLPTLCRETQTGFIPGRSILNNVAFNRDLIDWAERSKTPLTVAFLDFEKAFDRVWWHYLFRVLDHLGFPAELCIIIRALYTGFSSTLMGSGATQVVLRPSRGVRQGCPLSPALFALFAEPLGALIDALGAGGSSSPPPGRAPPGCGPPSAASHSRISVCR